MKSLKEVWSSVGGGVDIEKVLREDFAFFQVEKLFGGKVVWSDKKRVGQEGCSSILDRYGYLVPGSPCFSNVNLDPSQATLVGAEPYGGTGVGENGGGGRCANIGGMQVKGVGANPLVGDHDNTEHSYGGLDLRKAMVETVYSVVLNNLLPRRVVNIRALIFVGHDCALIGSRKAWGGLMVRDRCVRPGHFMRSPYFKPRAEVKSSVKDDLVRVRALYKRLYREFEGNSSDFIRWLGGYLRDVASQFAFARVMRITHGTMTASNISWDGKWLDLPACSFLSGGVNYSIWSQFYEEHNMALSYAMEVLHNYSKYNRVPLNPSPLVSYFNEQFQEYGKYYVGYALGLKLDYVLELPEESWKQVSETFLRVTHSGRKIEPRRPSYDPKDPVIALTAAFFMAHSGSSAFAIYAKKAGIDESEAARFKGASIEVLSAYGDLISSDGAEKGSFFMSSFLTSVKRALLPEMWYLPNVEGQVTRICSQGSPDEIGPYIDKHQEVAEWVFEEPDDKVTLLKEGSKSVFYLMSKGKFGCFDGRESRYFSCYGQLYDHACHNIYAIEPVIYDFLKFLERLGVMLRDLGHSHSAEIIFEKAYV